MLDLVLGKCSHDVNSCDKCRGICDAIGPYGTNIGLSYVKPKVPVEVFFIAESPPSTEKNFFYNGEPSDTRFRDRLFRLINLAGLNPVTTIEQFNDRGYYLADSINCGWNKNRDDVKQPSPRMLDMILQNCLEYLEIQIWHLKPKAVVIMGKIAQSAVSARTTQNFFDELKISKHHIVLMPFITTTPVKTEYLINKLSVLSGMGRDLNEEKQSAP